MVNISSSGNSEVWSNKMSLVEFLDLVGSHAMEVLSDTTGGLSNEVISERVLMDEVNECGLLVIHINGSPVKSISLRFNLSGIVERVLKDVAKEINSSFK